jgi:hypothetical protein
MMKKRRMRGAGHVTCMGHMRNGYKNLVGKPERKRPLGNPSRKNKDIKIEIGLEGVNCTHLAQERNRWQAVVNTG